MGKIARGFQNSGEFVYYKEKWSDKAFLNGKPVFSNHRSNLLWIHMFWDNIQKVHTTNNFLGIGVQNEFSELFFFIKYVKIS